MKKPIQITKQLSIKELKQLIKTGKDEGEKTRAKIILEVNNGLMRREIADKLMVNIDTITDVVKRYNKQGMESFNVNKGGRPEGNPKWNKQIFVDLKAEINKQKEYWSVPKMVEWIKNQKKTTIPEITVWYHMVHKHDMSYKSARPHPHLGNTTKQAEFKKKGFQIY